VPLQRKEINEIQTRLYTFGFNPGPIDGSPGPMTQIAAMRYRAERKLPQTDAINRELLEALRQDPAPQVAQAPPPPRPASQRTYYTQRRSDDPFESLRIAGDKFGRWLQSLGNN
jgi:peptidoglycan hydrolase-like protein with peptidoglycan-binding domain